MVWKGIEVVTIRDLAYAIEACESREEAQEFMRLYREETEHADANVGYMSGYYTPETADRIRDWFDVEHPIFGKRSPTPEQAFEAGRIWGEVMTGQGDD